MDDRGGGGEGTGRWCRHRRQFARGDGRDARGKRTNVSYRMKEKRAREKEERNGVGAREKRGKGKEMMSLVGDG